MTRVLHILDHSLPLHSGYTFRTRAIIRAQQALGMEVRGIARLEFERTDCVGALREGRIKELRATGGAS